MFCFINILNIFFSFVTCSMHNNPHQNAGNGNKGTLFFKIFLRSMPLHPLEVFALSARFGQIRVRPPPPSKFLGPYAYGCDKLKRKLAPCQGRGQGESKGRQSPLPDSLQNRTCKKFKSGELLRGRERFPGGAYSP